MRSGTIPLSSIDVDVSVRVRGDLAKGLWPTRFAASPEAMILHGGRLRSELEAGLVAPCGLVEIMMTAVQNR
jgi:hypothetical protein